MLDTITLALLISACAPMVAPDTMHAVITTESAGNPYAIGVVGGRLKRQPKNFYEALATVKALEQQGYNYSVGIAQVNKTNFAKYDLTHATMFDPCLNLSAGGRILQNCYTVSLKTGYPVPPNNNTHLVRSLSCYYSGQLDSKVGHAYAHKVLAQR